jgi:class 3 adenylate cyclase
MNYSILQQAEQLYNQALEEHKKHNLTAACVLCENAENIVSKHIPSIKITSETLPFLLLLLNIRTILLDIEWKQGNIEKGVQLGELQLKLIQEIQDEHECSKEYLRELLIIQANTYNSLGILHCISSDYPTAIEYFTHAIFINDSLENLTQVAGIYANMANVYSNLSNNELALEYSLKALDISIRINHLPWQANIYGNLGLIHKDLGKFTESVEYYQKAIEIHQQLQNIRGLSTNYLNLALLLEDQGLFEQALEKLYVALDLRKSVKDRHGTAIAEINIGRIYTNPKSSFFQPEIGEKFLLQALPMFLEIDDKKGVMYIYEAMSVLRQHQQLWQEACNYLNLFISAKISADEVEAKKHAEKFNAERRFIILKKVQEATDNVLKKTFPAAIIPALREGKEVVVETFSSASVLFADIVGFTELSMKIAPHTLVNLLNNIFTHFDTIAEKCGCERLRTIGDGYMAVAGVPTHAPDHAIRLVNMARLMLKDYVLSADIAQYLPENTSLEVRIGINAGALVAGITGGLVKIQYDIYGDTVNTAARMESYSKPGAIHCTSEFRHIYTEQFTSLFPSEAFPIQFIPREPLNIKGKGVMNTFFIEEV